MVDDSVFLAAIVSAGIMLLVLGGFRFFTWRLSQGWNRHRAETVGQWEAEGVSHGQGIVPEGVFERADGGFGVVLAAQIGAHSEFDGHAFSWHFGSLRCCRVHSAQPRLAKAGGLVIQEPWSI